MIRNTRGEMVTARAKDVALLLRKLTDIHDYLEPLRRHGIRYVVEGELGRGAMGVVLRARERATGRPVAIKLIAPGGAQGVRVERFRREGEALAALHHPGIVGIHGVGRAEGVDWLVLELVEGARPLDVAARTLGPRERVV